MQVVNSLQCVSRKFHNIYSRELGVMAWKELYWIEWSKYLEYPQGHRCRKANIIIINYY